jgi:kynurenine formamidase
MSKVTRISYPITEDAPVWPGCPRLNRKQLSSIARGDTANTYEIKLFNHFGTHIDGPKHFNDRGATISQLPVESFVYRTPYCIDLPKSFGEQITVNDIFPYEERLKVADLLLIRTGFSAERSRNPARYASEGPGVHSSTSRYLIEQFPQLKALGLDFLSLASYSDQTDGVLSHQYMLGAFNPECFCLIIEDIDLSELVPEKLLRVLAFPLLVDGLDSAPATVIAEHSE